MIEADDSEINIDLLMARIREGAEARKAGNGTSLVDASAVLRDLLKSNGKPAFPVQLSLSEPSSASQPSTFQPSPSPPVMITRLSLQPEFEPRDDDHYHVKDLLLFHDLEFIRNAYRAILKREPDDPGLAEFLSNLRSGRFNKIDVLASLRFSPEGKMKGVRVDGLSFPAYLRRLYRVPALGYLLELTVGLFRLPVLLRSQRQLEAYSVAQDERLAGHVNLMNARLADAVTQRGDQWARELFDGLSGINERLTEDLSEMSAQQAQLAEEFSRELSRIVGELSESYRKVTGLQHQQIGALFREQQELVEDQKRLRADLHAYLGAEQERARLQLEAQEKYDERLAHAGAQYETVVEYIDTRVREVAQKLQRTRAELVLNERRLTLLLEEARKRLPEPFTPAELQTMAVEEQHVLDALYASFEDQFRGSREDIKERFRIYVPMLREAAITSDILDIGCGRGEWLEVMKEEGLAARGVEQNRAMIEQCREHGLEAVDADAVAYLEELPPASISAVTGFHFIEHLPFETLLHLLDEIVRVLKPGGMVIFETPNAENVLVGSHYFYFDPTHRNPLPGPVAQFLLESRGLSRVEVMKLHPADELRVEGEDELTERFNEYFFGPMDYAVIGRKL